MVVAGFLLVVLAAMMAMLYLFRVFQLDRIEREPLEVLGLLILVGMISGVPAAFLELSAETFLKAKMVYGRLLFQLVDNFLIVAVAEELCKYCFMRLFTWKNKSFYCRYDAVAYAVYVSGGFALAEAVLYGIVGGFWGTIIRAFTAVPCHIICAVYMGYFYGLEKQYAYRGEGQRRWNCLALSLLFPILIHGAYDFGATGYFENEWGMLLIFYLVIIALNVFMFRKADMSSQMDEPFVESKPEWMEYSDEMNSEERME